MALILPTLAPEKFDEMLKNLTDCRGVSGDEARVREFIRGVVTEIADEITVDRIGNLIATKRGSKPGAPKVLLCAHMDEVGLIIKGINDNGLLSYETVGGIDARAMVSKRVTVGSAAVPGVIGAKAIHLQTPEEFTRALKHEDLYIDIGAKDKAAAEKLVSLGDCVYFDSAFVAFGEDMIKAKALDDRVGCLTLIRVLTGSYPGDVVCAFTVQEEIGLNGARVIGQTQDIDLALVMEGTAANDLGDVPEHLTVCHVGQGVAISFMDRASVGHTGLVKALKDAATRHNIPWQVKRFVSGGNDAGAIQSARGAKPVAVLSVPCRYIHSHASVACRADIDAQAQLAAAFLLGLKEGF